MNFWPLLTVPSLWSTAQKLRCRQLIISYFPCPIIKLNGITTVMIGTLALLCLFQLDIRTNLKLVLYSHHTNLNLCGLSLTGIHFNLKSPKAPSADAMEHIGSCITQLEQAYSSKDFVNATSIRISKARIFMHSTFLLYRAVRSTEECSWLKTTTSPNVHASTMSNH